MSYQISYVSPAHHAQKLAEAFHRVLPSNTPVTDLSRDAASADAETHLVGFELTGNSDAIPYPILEHLEQLEDKVVTLFVTSPFEPSEEIKEKVENRIIPFLPDSCDYRGIFLSYGEVAPELMRDLRGKLAEQPENERAQELLYGFQESVGHPDTGDINRGITFLTEVLKLDV